MRQYQFYQKMFFVWDCASCNVEGKRHNAEKIKEIKIKSKKIWKNKTNFSKAIIKGWKDETKSILPKKNLCMRLCKMQRWGQAAQYWEDKKDKHWKQEKVWKEDKVEKRQNQFCQKKMQQPLFVWECASCSVEGKRHNAEKIKR